DEAQRRAENAAAIENLDQRVDDWKGQHLHNFGDLLLNGIFIVTKLDISRKYHIFLFERIIAVFKEVPISGVNSSSTPLLLKGCIFLRNTTRAIRSSCSLVIYYKGDDDEEFFMIQFWNEEQTRQWELSVKRLMKRFSHNTVPTCMVAT
ncbi:Pleckstrin homology domain-containing protein, partial [Mycena olivaceomarginata]